MNSSQRFCSTLNSKLSLISWVPHSPRTRFYLFPHHIETATFSVGCDAFANMKDILTRHKPMVADFLDKNYDKVHVSPSLFSPVFTPRTVLCVLYAARPVL